MPSGSALFISAIRFPLRRERPSGGSDDAALTLLQKLISRRLFTETSLDMDAAIERACSLSAKHTERLGCRGFDLLHVAMALDLECEVFLTSDLTQAALARAEGLSVTARME